MTRQSLERKKNGILAGYVASGTRLGEDKGAPAKGAGWRVALSVGLLA